MNKIPNLLEKIEKFKKIIEEHEDRISKLEKQFNSKTTESKSGKTKKGNSNYSGTTGGIRLLIDKEFLNKPKSSKEIHEEMNRKGYYKPIKNMDSALRLGFVKQKILERVKKDKVWKYVIRK